MCDNFLDFLLHFVIATTTPSRFYELDQKLIQERDVFANEVDGLKEYTMKVNGKKQNQDNCLMSVKKLWAGVSFLAPARLSVFAFV
jgi:hypothetical protein